MSHPVVPSVLSRRLAGGALAVLLAFAAAGVRAQAPSASGTDIMRSFYATLLGTMENGAKLGASGRYARLQPVVHKVFDVAFMTRLAVGPSWNTLSSAEQQRVTEAFERYISATWADRFDSYSGEKLEVAGEQAAGPGVVVWTRIVKSNGEPVSINYLMRRNGDSWQISDIYLDGTISELATRRSEFSSILRDKGIDGLIAALNRKADLLSAQIAKAS